MRMKSSAHTSIIPQNQPNTPLPQEPFSTPISPSGWNMWTNISKAENKKTKNKKKSNQGGKNPKVKGFISKYV